jgi:hypothetical protein
MDDSKKTLLCLLEKVERLEKENAVLKEWQPIETAPTHKEVLVYRSDAGVMLGILTCLADWLIHEDDLSHDLTEDELWENRWFAMGKSGAMPLKDDGGDPTHWMLLPEEPA